MFNDSLRLILKRRRGVSKNFDIGILKSEMNLGWTKTNIVQYDVVCVR